MLVAAERLLDWDYYGSCITKMEQMELEEGSAPAAAASGSRPSSSGSVSVTATSRPASGGVKSKLSLKRKRTVDSNGTSKPSAATANSQRAEDTSTSSSSSSSSSSLTRKKGGTRRKKRVISGVFAARRQQQQQAAAATTSGTGLTFPDDVTYKFGGGAGHNDGSTTKKQTGSSSECRSNGTAPNRSANSDDDTDPCSSGTEENEFDWSQSQRQSQIQKQQTGNANIEDSQDSMESGGSLQSAASGSADGSSKQPAKRRKRNAIGTSNNNGKPPIPSFSPVEWSGRTNDDDSKADQTKPTQKADKSTIMPKPKSKQKATKSIKRVGVGLGSPSSSSSSDENEGSAVSKGKNANSTKKDKESENPHTVARSSPGISSNDRAASAAARGDEALALVEAALAKSASASGTESAPAGKVSVSNVPSKSISKENVPAPALDLSTAANLAPVYDNVEMSAPIFAADSANNSNATATASAPASESKGTASKGWNCSACTLLNPSRKRKCEACGKTKPVESRAVGDGQGAKSPVIDLSLDDAGEKDNVTDNGKQQQQKERQTKAAASKKESVKEKKKKSMMTAKKQSGQDVRAKESSTDTKKGKRSKAGKKEDTATTATGTTKPKAAQKKRKQQQQPKKRAAAVLSSPIDDDAFDIPVSKQISDKEKMLDRQHADLLRQLAKKPSPGKDSDGDDKSAPKRTKRGGAACALCSTCSCSRGSALKGLEETAQMEAKNPISKLARSDAEIERALLGRLARLEKSASWFDTLCYKVGRELKKHRNKVTKKRASLDENNGGGNGEESKPRFLADADVDGQDKGIFYPRAKKSRVAKAHQGLFGTEPTAKEAQPTLTQMMKGEDGDDKSDDDDDTGDEKKAPDVLVEVNAPKGMELEPIAEEDNGALQNLGSEDNEVYVVEDGAANDSIIYEESEEGSPVEVRSPMADYHDASQRGLERTSENSLVGMWDAAKSSALSKRDADVLDSPGKQDSLGKESASHTTADKGIDDDLNRKVDAAIYDDPETGIDDLLELFQGGPTSVPSSTPSPEKSKPPPEIQSQLTQRGQNAFEEISESIMADPARRQAIEAICPNWRDNIQYPLLHKKSDDLEEALANVRDSRRKLQVARERILTELKQREEAMDLFEEAISSSMNRFAASTNNDVPGSPDSGIEEKKSN